jgi:tripartite-type tricarboxylate transporter receptor subunit TctC
VAAEVPKERAAVLRKAFWAAMMDPALKAQAKERRLDYNPIAGEEIDRIIANGMKGASEPAVLKMFRELMGAKAS